MSDALSALLHLSAHDYSWLAQFFSLLFLPFAHEDLAIILGAYVVVNDSMPVGLVALCIYGGIGRERLRFVRDWREREASAVAQPPCGRRSSAQFHRYAQTQSVRDRRALPRGARRRLRGLCRLRMEASAARPFHRRKPGGVRALSAAHALHRGLLRRRARWSCWLVDVAVPALCVGGDRIRPSTGFQLPASAQAGRWHTADPRPAA